MRFLGVHPGPLLYSRIFLRLEPLGLELVAQAARRAGHAVRLIDLQAEDQAAYFRLLESWRPDVVAFSCNYLANVPAIVDLAKATKARLPGIFVCVGGHSASFTASTLIEHGAGAIDCVLKGEGEAAMPLLLAAIEAGTGVGSVPGAVTSAGEGLRKHRKRVALGRNFEALEFARSLGIMIAVNLIADPDWDHERFRIVREWGVELPEVINISVNTPYPGTESWATAGSEVASRDYRLYDIQHAVLPTRLPLAEFYDELVTTQRAFYRKHLGWRRLIDTAGVVAGHLSHGQTNFLRSLFLLDRVYRPELLLADHTLPVKYQMPLPRPLAARQSTSRALYIHSPRGRKGRAIDGATERFVEETRMGATP